MQNAELAIDGRKEKDNLEMEKNNQYKAPWNVIPR